MNGGLEANGPDADGGLPPVAYQLELTRTASATGYFSCVPAGPPEVGTALDYLRRHPLDTFMHQYLLRYLGYWQPDRLEGTIARTPVEDPVMRALLLEACLVYPRFKDLSGAFSVGEMERLAGETPLIEIKSALQPDRSLHNRWISAFSFNILAHHPLPEPSEGGAPKPPLFSLPAAHPVSIDRLDPKEKSAVADEDRQPPMAVFGRAIEALADAGVRLGEEMRHLSSLSPVALLREWEIRISVETGRHHYVLSGIQTAYGRGLAVEPARAAYAMEIVERCSAFASAGPRGMQGYRREYPLVRATLSALQREASEAVLDPSELLLEVPYKDEPLYWLTADRCTPEGDAPIRIPAQSVFLFANFDEIGLFSGLGSTGLAAGCTPEQARAHALLELIERDAEATVPFRADQCFALTAEDPAVASLLDEYRQQGIHVRFQVLDSGFGVPCYKCFVETSDGCIVKGTAAHLDGRRAVLSAMTETPYSRIGAPPSRPPATEPPVRTFEQLPDYSTGNDPGDLDLLERLLMAGGFSVIYTDLTRSDLEIPVVRAMVPGMALSADFDRFSRVHPRLFTNYSRR